MHAALLQESQHDSRCSFNNEQRVCPEKLQERRESQVQLPIVQDDSQGSGVWSRAAISEKVVPFPRQGVSLR